MPCTTEMIEKAVLCASGFRLVSFTASPATATPGQSVTLRWNIDRSAECSGQFKINGISASMDGSKVVTPLSDTTYTLSVSTGCNITRNLGRVTVEVNESSCRITTIPESLVRGQIIGVVDANIQEFNRSSDNDLSKRTQTQVEIDNSGITVRLRLKAAINNFPDPDLDVDMKIGIGVGPGNTVSVFYRSFSVDVDWPWWVSGISLGITKIVEEIVEDRIEAKIKGQILDSLRTRITETARQIPGVLAGIQTFQDELRLKIC
jgi:hypothetical protein